MSELLALVVVAVSDAAADAVVSEAAVVLVPLEAVVVPQPQSMPVRTAVIITNARIFLRMLFAFFIFITSFSFLFIVIVTDSLFIIAGNLAPFLLEPLHCVDSGLKDDIAPRHHA